MKGYLADSSFIPSLYKNLKNYFKNNENVKGEVSYRNVETWTFEATEGDSVDINLNNVLFNFWWFEVATQVGVNVIDSNNTIVNSATCGNGLCMELNSLDAGEYTVEINSRGYKTNYELQITSGYCLEIFADSAWPCMGECDPTPFKLYLTKNV